MRRIRILRIVLPAALILFVVLLAVAIRPRMRVHGGAQNGNGGSRPKATEINIKELDRDMRPKLEFSADVVEELEEQRLHAEKIREFKVYQVDRDPLVVSAEVGDVAGPSGERKMHFKDTVRIFDSEDSLTLDMPFLDVDEAKGEARSRGAILIEGPNRKARVSELIYGLSGQPTELIELEVEQDDGTRVTAPRALLLDGLDDVELLDHVVVERAPDRFTAGRLRALRGPDERLKKIVASGGAQGSWTTDDGESLAYRSELLEVEWDAPRQPSRLVLRGGAELSDASHTLTASSIAGRCQGSGPERRTCEVVAEGTVYLQGRLPEGIGWLRADRLEASLTGRMEIRSAEVRGRVRFEAPDTRAEAERATMTPGDGDSSIRLFSSERRRARLVRGRTRVAADRITTDPRGERLQAEGRVEATLLGAGGTASPSALSGLFGNRDAIHFVASRMESEQVGAHLVFSGGVRGWQGDQNLSAERIVVDDPGRRLTATERVTTRLPREAQGAARGEADFVQVGADSLVYEDERHLAVYTGRVRVGLSEGWMESERLDVVLGETGRGIREIRASAAVRVEFRQPNGEQGPRLINGTADRLVYTPTDQTVLLYGDESPATVQQIGKGGGTTSGRVLRYHVDRGTLEVDSGASGPGTIKTEGVNDRQP